ncbi:MAG: hypothetical protein ACI8Q2_000213, partial [Candidatus Omnitrophota bacterium]
SSKGSSQKRPVIAGKKFFSLIFANAPVTLPCAINSKTANTSVPKGQPSLSAAASL